MCTKRGTLARTDIHNKHSLLFGCPASWLAKIGSYLVKIGNYTFSFPTSYNGRCSLSRGI